MSKKVASPAKTAKAVQTMLKKTGRDTGTPVTIGKAPKGRK